MAQGRGLRGLLLSVGFIVGTLMPKIGADPTMRSPVVLAEGAALSVSQANRLLPAGTDGHWWSPDGEKLVIHQRPTVEGEAWKVLFWHAPSGVLSEVYSSVKANERVVNVAWLADKRRALITLAESDRYDGDVAYVPKQKLMLFDTELIYLRTVREFGPSRWPITVRPSPVDAAAYVQWGVFTGADRPHPHRGMIVDLDGAVRPSFLVPRGFPAGRWLIDGRGVFYGRAVRKTNSQRSDWKGLVHMRQTGQVKKASFLHKDVFDLDLLGEDSPYLISITEEAGGYALSGPGGSRPVPVVAGAQVVRVSPGGKWLSFERAGSLYVRSIEKLPEQERVALLSREVGKGEAVSAAVAEVGRELMQRARPPN